AARVEAVPPEPENQAADRAQDDVVRQRRTAAVAGEHAAQAWAEHDGASKGDCAANRMDDGRSREVAERHGHHGEPAVRPPGPVADDRVNESGHADAVEDVALEAAAADHSA